MEPNLGAGLPKKYQRWFARLRLSSHQLEIELGRYNKPTPVPATERVCRQCASGCVKDEIHFMLHCEEFSKHRKILKTEIMGLGLSFSGEGHKGLNDLLSSDHPAALFAVGKFIDVAMKQRV